MKFGDIIGGINTAMGIGGALFGNNRAFGQQKDLMALQMGNQQLLNAQAQQYSKDLWDYTNFANQRKHLEKAGLSVGLMYGKRGAEQQRSLEPAPQSGQKAQEDRQGMSVRT